MRVHTAATREQISRSQKLRQIKAWESEERMPWPPEYFTESIVAKNYSPIIDLGNNVGIRGRERSRPKGTGPHA